MKKITLSSGFSFDYTNIMMDGGVVQQDIEESFERIANAVKASERVRRSGIVDGHLSKDGEPEAVLFPQLPYIEEGNINSPAVLHRLEALGKHAQAEIDAVVSFGIGGSYLGGKVLFDVHCGEFWNSMSAEERNQYPRLYFSGNNVMNHLKDRITHAVSI